LTAGEPGVYATTLWSPVQIRETIALFAQKNQISKLRVVDGISCVTAQVSKEPYTFQNLYDLNTINLVLLQTIAGIEYGHLCVDNLTTLMTYSAPLSVIKFLQVLCARVKDQGVTGLYLLESGVHTNEIVTTLCFSVDGVIEIDDEEVDNSIQHRLRLAHLRGIQADTRWMLYDEKNALEWL
ncbi:MAG: RAD55 family ATPase, partial [Candidatus Thorarchaeota archaeon]